MSGHVKGKNSAIPDQVELTKAYINSQNANPSEFLQLAIFIQKDLIDRPNDETLYTKELIQASSKAVNDSLVIALRTISSETSDPKKSLLELLKTLQPIFWIFAFLLKRSTLQVKMEKNVVDHFNSLCRWIVNNDNLEFFIDEIFRFLHVMFGIALCKNKKISRQDEIFEKITAMSSELLDIILTNKKYHELTNFIVCFSSSDKSISIMSNLDQEVVRTDLIHYILAGIDAICKEDPSISADFVKQNLPSVLVSLVSVPDFRGSVSSHSSALAIQKYLYCVNILKALCVSSKKQEIARNFFRSNSGDMKNIFFYILLNYSRSYYTSNSRSFKNDQGILGQMYSGLFEIFSNVLCGTEQEGFPVLLFSVILQPDISMDLIKNPPQIQAFTLEFLLSYLDVIGRKKETRLDNLKECKLIEILFSAPLFQVEATSAQDPHNYTELANETWEKIWSYHINTQQNLKWISKSITDSIKFNQDNIPHLLKIDKWVQEQALMNEELIINCISTGLIENLFNVISAIKKQQIHTESLISVFVSINNLLKLIRGTELQNSGHLMDLILQDSYVLDPECSDLTMACLSSILGFQNDENFSKFGKKLKDIANVSIKIKLLNSMQDTLKDSSTKTKCQLSFLKANTLSTLKELITGCYDDSPEIITLWVSILECVRFMIEDNPICKKHLQDFDFSAVANTIRSQRYSRIRNEIYIKSIESLLYILFETNNIGKPQLRNVKTPEVIPLVIELLSDCDNLGSAKEYFEHISVCLEDSYNSAHFANSRTTDLLLDALERGSSEFLLNFISRTLPQVICHHITPQELKKIIEIGRRNTENREKQLILYKSLSNAIKNSCCSTEHYKFEANHTCLSPTRYFCFRESKSLLKCAVSSSESLLPPKEFSIFFWAYPDGLPHTSTLLQFLSPSSYCFVVSLCGDRVMVEYFQDKLVFAIISEDVVSEKQWNLIGISLKPPAKLKFTGDKPELEIFINANKSLTKIQNKIERPKDNFSTLYLGNSENMKSPYMGRIISFYISRKALSLNHFKEIFFLSFQYNLGFNPEALSTSEEFKSDKSALKFIFDHLTFQWHSRGTMPELATIENCDIRDECERFNGVSIIESISANGGLVIFLPLIKEWADSKGDMEGIIVLLDVIADVCIAQSVEMILDESFFDLLVFVLEESIKKPEVQLVDALIKIVGHLEWSPTHHKKALKCLFLNKRLWHDLDEESNSHYTGTLSLNIRKHFKCEQETLYELFDQLSAIQKNFNESFMEIWQNLIPDEIEADNIDGILILIFSMSESNIQLLCRFISILDQKRFKKDCFDSLTFTMLYLMKKLGDGFTQSCFLKFILKLTEELCEEISKEKRLSMSLKDEFEFVSGICSAIDRALGRNIVIETSSELITFCKKSFRIIDKKKCDKFINFINIITKRLLECKGKQELCNRLCGEADDMNFALLLFERDNFPMWLIGLYPESPQEMERLALNIFKNCANVKNFNKLKTFLIEIIKHFPHTGLTWTLLFYHKLLIDLKGLIFVAGFESQTGKSVAVHFLDYIGVLEDILDPSIKGSNPVDLQVYIPLLGLIYETGNELQLIYSTYPPLPNMTFEVQLILMMEKLSPNVPDSNIVYLREGGFLRLILKFLFIGLAIKQDESLIQILKKVLKGGSPNANYLTFSNEQRNRWESRFTGANVEKYTDSLYLLKDRKDDDMYSIAFLTQYIIAECTEILDLNEKNPIIDFLKEFIRDSEALTAIENKYKKDQIDIENFYTLLQNNKLFVHSTSRSLLEFAERNQNIEMLNHYLDSPNKPDMKNFLSEMKELFKAYKVPNCDLAGLLTSEKWITRVHFFFIASTSMRLNFMASCVRPAESSAHFDTRLGDDNEKIDTFVKSKQDSFEKSIRIYEQKLDRSRRMAEKNYKKFCKNVEELKLIMTGKVFGRFRLKDAMDGIGRMPFIEKRMQEEILDLPKNRMSLANYQQIKVPILGNKLTESLEESTQANDSEGEDIPPTIYNDLDDVLRMDCERIKVQYTVFGFLEISQDYLLYVSEGKDKPKEDLYFGSALEFTMLTKKCEKIWQTNGISEVFARRFTHKHSAFEVYLKNGKSLYFNVFDKGLRDKAFKLMRSWTLKGVRVVADPKSLLQRYKKRWQKGQMSNLEYLLFLNKSASRSFNDISQYPIFPWILKNYYDNELNLDDSTVFRNLALPIGAQTEEGRNEAKRKFSMFVDEDVEQFHYGSHYSSAGIVLHYLVRVDPFTELAKSLQGGSFDVADRLFYSVQASWESGQGTTGDVKELVPEMFYLPEILLNLNKEDLGTRQDDVPVHDVCLPAWAKTAVDFIIKHRKALESNYVSSHLHEWIDLIFGYKQKGLQAEISFNRFSSLTYEESFVSLKEKLKKDNEGENLESLQGYVEQIVHFGQTPVQLFKGTHPAKEIKTKQYDIYDKWKSSTGSVDFEEFRSPGYILALLANSQAIWSVKASNGYLFISKESSPDNKVTVRLEGARDMKLDDWEEAVQWKYTFNSSSNLVLERNDQQYCLWGEELLVSGFHIDNSFKIHTLKGSLFKSIHHHAGLVTCVTSTNEILFTGSMDTSIAAWQTFPQNNEKIKPFNIYLGHSEAIRQLVVQSSYNILFSLSVNGVAIVHEIRSANCLRRLAFDQPIRLITVSEYGLVALNIQKIGIKMFTFNETEVNKYSQVGTTKFMKFNEAGDMLVYGTQLQFGLFDVLEDNQRHDKDLRDDKNEFEIETFATAPNKDYFMVGLNSKTDCKILTLGKIREKRVNRPY